MKQLRILLLGNFTAEAETGAVSLGRSDSYLLAYLALCAGRFVARQRIAGAMWVDYTESRARANLSTTIWRLRAALSRHGVSDDIIRTSSDSLGIDVDLCVIDAVELKRAMFAATAHVASLDAISRATRALDLYRGDLLEDWDVEWCRLEREELRQRYVRTLGVLSETFEQRGRPDLALQFVRRATEADPFDETAQRRLIRLLSSMGDRMSAVAQFTRFARLVRSELGVEPDKETVDLVGKINGAAQRQRGPEPVKLPHPLIRLEKARLVGRGEERRTLTDFLEGAWRNAGGAILITGDAGVGKSRLVDWTMEEWAARGGTLGRGRCIEFNEPVPYQPLLDALGQIVDTEDLSEFVGLSGNIRNSSLGEPEPGISTQHLGSESTLSAGKLRLFTWLRSRLQEASLKCPVLIVVEDIQWADVGTLDFLTYLLEQTRHAPVVVIISSRPAGSSRHARSVRRLSRHCAGVISLGPLSRSETLELVRSLLDESQLPTGISDWIYDETEGNPLFVIETLRLLQQRHDANRATNDSLPRRTDSDFRHLVHELPEGVRVAVEQRLGLIEPACLRIAQIASVLGRSFDEELLEMVAGIRGNRLARAIACLLRVGIFEREGAGYRFAHDKIRSVCYEKLASSVRRTFHARAAAALASMGQVAVHRLAWHQYSAGHWSMAASSWESAGDHAKDVYAYEEALSAYRYGILCVAKDKTIRSDEANRREAILSLKLDEVLANLGRLRERREILGRVGILCRSDFMSALLAAWLCRRALLEEHVGNFGTASALARKAWFAAKARHEPKDEIEALRILAWTLNRAGRHERSVLVSRLALKTMQDARTPSLVSTLWQTAAVHLKLSRYAAAATLLQRAERLAVELGLQSELLHIAVARGVLDKWTGRIGAARAGLDRALKIASQTYDPIGTARATFHLATLDALEGQLPESLRRLRRASVISRSVGYSRTHLACLNNIAYGVGRLLGNYKWAWKASSHALRMAEASGSKLLAAMCMDSQAILLIEQGRIDEAMVVTNQVLGLLRNERGSMGPNQESIARRGVIWFLRGQLDEALADLESARHAQTKMGDRLVLVDTLAYLALVHAKKGDSSRAIATSEEAVKLIAEVGYANMQPQRIFWHHYQILETFGREPRIQFLRRAAEFVETQASMLSRGQQLRFRRDVGLNRAILSAWQQLQSRSVEPGLTVSLPQSAAR